MTLDASPGTSVKGKKGGASNGATDPIDDAIAQTEILSNLDIPKDIWESEALPGFKFRLKTVSQHLINSAGRQFPEPVVPVLPNPDKERDEPNPQDPDYLRAVNERNINIGEVTQRLYLAYGAELLEKPDNIAPCEDTSWSDDIKDLTGLDTPTSGRARYVAWLRMYALENEDRFSLITSVMRFNGIIFEVEVDKATDDLKSDETRKPDTDSEAKETT